MKQQVIFTLELKENDMMNINLEFEPGLAGEGEYNKLTKEQKYLHNYALDVAGYVMESLKSNKQ